MREAHEPPTNSAGLYHALRYHTPSRLLWRYKELERVGESMAIEPLGEIIVAVGDAVAKDSEFLNEKKETKSKFIRAMFYLIPMSLLTGFYIWTVYF